MTKRWRGTLDAFFSGTRRTIPISGIYLIAYMGTVLYVGKAVDIPLRMRGHVGLSGKLAIDRWLTPMATFDPQNIRVDIWPAPPDADDHWLRDTEIRAIKMLSPLFNVMHMPKALG